MPNPTIPHIIGITTASQVEGDAITITNLSRSTNRVLLNNDANNKVLTDLKNTMVDYQAGDVLLIEARGLQEGGRTYTVAGSGTNTTVSTATASRVAVSI